MISDWKVYVLLAILGGLAVGKVLSSRQTPDPTNGTGTLIIETGQTMKVNGEDVPIYRFYHEQEVRSE